MYDVYGVVLTNINILNMIANVHLLRLLIITCILTAVFRLIRHVSTTIITVAVIIAWNTAAVVALELVVTACCTATLTRSSGTAEKQ